VLVRTGPLRARGAASAVLVFNDVTDLRRLEAVRRDLVANVSHELRTPLTAIRGYAETLQDGALKDPERAAEFIAIIHRHAERLSRLLDDLLELSRLEAGSRPLKREPVTLGPVVGRALDLVRPKAETRQVLLQVELSERWGKDGPELVGDTEALEQVLVNLVDNAVKYTPPGGRVRLALGPSAGDGGTVRVTVSDTGVGIERAQLPRVFERFYRVDSGRSRDTGGTGLGLAIVKHLTQAMGGRVGVESEIGKGSTFWLELPLAQGRTQSGSGAPAA
jgi:two-component system phosphate regulon sensor histidine kinase PhoR